MSELSVCRVIGWDRDLNRKMRSLPPPFFTVSRNFVFTTTKNSVACRLGYDEDERFFDIFRYAAHAHAHTDDPYLQEAHKAVWPCSDNQALPVFVLREHVFEWIGNNVPDGDWTYETLYTPITISGEIKFRSKEKAALFKLFWF